MDDTFLQQSTGDPMAYADKIERMYPDVYKRIMPYIDSAVQQLGENHDLSEDQLNSLTHQVVMGSAIMQSLPYGHNEHTINDIVKVLLLTTIYNTYHDDSPYYPYPYGGYPYPYPYSYPYPAPYILPFIDGFGHGFRGGFHRGFRR